jgi:hypothetical protein
MELELESIEVKVSMELSVVNLDRVGLDKAVGIDDDSIFEVGKSGLGGSRLRLVCEQLDSKCIYSAHLNAQQLVTLMQIKDTNPPVPHPSS